MKRGLSTIVSTLLILLLVFVAIGILWVVVRNVIQGGTEQVSLGKFTLDLAIEKVTIAGNSLSVKVKRNPGAGTFTGLNFILDDGDDTEVFQVKNLTMGEYSVRTFSVPLQNLVAANVQKVEIAPIFTLESGKEVVGDIKDTYTISKDTGTPYVPPAECTLSTNCSPNNCQIATCPSGTCVYTAITECSSTSDGCCPSGCDSTTDADCLECSDDTICNAQDSTTAICLTGDVYTRTTDWSCGSENVCESETTDILYEDCDDGNSSTTDTCSSGSCVHTPITSCTDSDGACPSGCYSGNDNDCTNECVLDIHCDDSDSCTEDTCSSGSCSNDLICISDGTCCSACSSDPDCGSNPTWETGLVSWWTLNTDASDSVGSNDGTVSGATHLTSGCQYGGGCYSFDGSDDYIDVGTFSISGDEITISAWVNYDGGAYDPRIMSKGTSVSVSDQDWVLMIDLYDTLEGRIATNGGDAELFYGGGVTSGIWTHLMLVYDGSVARLYKDSSLSGSLTKSGSLITNSNPVWIGGQATTATDRPFDGKIDEVMIWDRALNFSEVSDLYNYFS